MSQEQVDQVLWVYEAINRGDFEAVAARVSPDFEFIPPAVLPDVDVFRGPGGVRRFFDEWGSAFEEFRFEIEETIDAGDNVMVMAAVAGTGKDSGAPVKTPSFGQVWTFAEGRLVRMEAFPNRVEALAASGLSES
jgi:ketosteroid isomerase-like protein